MDAKESISNLNIEELNLEELDKKVVEVTEEAKNYANPTLPPSGLFPTLLSNSFCISWKITMTFVVWVHLKNRVSKVKEQIEVNGFNL